MWQVTFFSSDFEIITNIYRKWKCIDWQWGMRFKIPMFKMPMNQNTKRHNKNTNRHNHYQNTNNAFSKYQFKKIVVWKYQWRVQNTIEGYQNTNRVSIIAHCHWFMSIYDDWWLLTENWWMVNYDDWWLMFMLMLLLWPQAVTPGVTQVAKVPSSLGRSFLDLTGALFMITHHYWSAAILHEFRISKESDTRG